MKWLVLQVLLLLCMEDPSVSGKWKDRMLSEIQISDYILSRPKLPSCTKIPTMEQCRTSCRARLECQLDYQCCHALCGNICMSTKDTEDEMSDYSISTMMPDIKPLDLQ